MEMPDGKHGEAAWLPDSRSSEDVEWRRQLDLKWFGMGGPARIQLFGGQYIPDETSGKWQRVSPVGGETVRTRVLARPWVRVVFSLEIAPGEPEGLPVEMSPVDLLFPPSPEEAGEMFAETGFVVDLLVDDYVFHRKELRLQWQCPPDGHEGGTLRKEGSGVLSGRFRVTLEPTLSGWELRPVVEAVRSEIQSRGVTDGRLATGGCLLAPHPGNPFQNADEALVFVGGCWLSLRLRTMTFAEGIECPVGYGRTVPLWMPLSRDRYYLTDELLRGKES